MSTAPPISVCHVASGDRWAGAEAQISSVLRELASDAGFRLSAVLLNPGRLADELREAGVDVLMIPEAEIPFGHICRRTADFVREHQVRILHSHRYKENLIAAIAGWASGVPFRVRTQHGMTEPFRGWRSIKHSMVQAIDRFVLRSTNRVIAVSSDMQAQLRRRAGERVVLVPNGIDTDRVRSGLTSSQAKQRLGIAADAWVVGFVGRLEPVKRLDIFLQATSALVQRAPGTEFVIGGSGAEEARVRALAAELNLGDRLRVLGHRDDVYDVLRALDVFVVCSDHEGLPMTLLEAMFLRVPVVARAVGGIMDVIEDGQNGILVRSSEPGDLADACLKMRSADRERLTAAAAQRVTERFSARGSAQTLAAVYHDLLSQKKG